MTRLSLDNELHRDQLIIPFVHPHLQVDCTVCTYTYVNLEYSLPTNSSYIFYEFGKAKHQSWSQEYVSTSALHMYMY